MRSIDAFFETSPRARLLAMVCLMDYHVLMDTMNRESKMSHDALRIAMYSEMQRILNLWIECDRDDVLTKLKYQG
jgi:hypothetical protein